MQRHYIIGDIHGKFETLFALISKLPKDAKLIFVGDLIDRGCGRSDGEGKLSAYCIETHEIIEKLNI